jgi:predicted transcriptional regulator
LVTLTPDECRELRLRLGISSGELARCAGLIERTVIRFEAGLVAPRVGTVIALRRALRRLQPAGEDAPAGVP